MKKGIFTIAILALIQFAANSQSDKLTIGADISLGKNLTTVKDENGATSAQNISADGTTDKVDNENAIGLHIIVDYALSEKFKLSSGLELDRTKLNIRNTDGSYSGVSTYQTTYVTIPLQAKYVLADVIKEVDVEINAGLGIGVKVGEDVDGGDGAHYWNLAQNNTSADPTRGQNGDNKAVDLFNTLNASFLLGGTAIIPVSDKFDFAAGLQFDFGLLNTVNSDLTFKNGTNVNDDVTFRNNIVSLDLGLRMKL